MGVSLGVYVSLADAETVVSSRFRGILKTKVQPSFWEISYTILQFKVLVSFSQKSGNVSLWMTLPSGKRELIHNHNFSCITTLSEAIQHTYIWLYTLQRCLLESLEQHPK